jgi:predicted HTH transcriptional regulator
VIAISREEEIQKRLIELVNALPEGGMSATDVRDHWKKSDSNARHFLKEAIKSGLIKAIKRPKRAKWNKRNNERYDDRTKFLFRKVLK